MSPSPLTIDPGVVEANVRAALAEDVGSGDVTAELIPAAAQAHAHVVCREQAVLAGRPWFDQTFAVLDDAVRIEWQAAEGAALAAGATVCTLHGPARAIVTGERTALNFLQALSGTATVTRRYAEALGGGRTRVLDTRKTLPGLRAAQKYAVRAGGGENHRMGLYDAVLIKENHIAAAGSIAAAVGAIRAGHPALPIEVEVESLDELDLALAAGADRVLLDNFTLEMIRAAVARVAGRIPLEVSGGIEIERLPGLAATGVDYVSVGALTKHLRAVDFSMRIDA